MLVSSRCQPCNLAMPLAAKHCPAVRCAPSTDVSRPSVESSRSAARQAMCCCPQQALLLAHNWLHESVACSQVRLGCLCRFLCCCLQARFAQLWCWQVIKARTSLSVAKLALSAATGSTKCFCRPVVCCVVDLSVWLVHRRCGCEAITAAGYSRGSGFRVLLGFRVLCCCTLQQLSGFQTRALLCGTVGVGCLHRKQINSAALCTDCSALGIALCWLCMLLLFFTRCGLVNWPWFR